MTISPEIGVNTILNVKNLSKKFKNKIAVEGVSFSIKEGEFVGLLGPNAAGKTTTIKMLTGLIKPTNGKILYYGKDFFKYMKQIKGFIGVVHQYSNLDYDLTAYENLYLHAILYKVPRLQRKKRIEEALEFAGLTEQMYQQVKTFSGGMKRRLVIIRSLLHYPKILFLDEPTVGLDPQIRRNLWDLLLKINQIKKMAILLTTHYIEEAEKLCKRVMLINNGKIIADASPDELKDQIGKYVLEVFHKDRIEEMFFSNKQKAMDALKQNGSLCRIREVSLEDVFLKLIDNDKKDNLNFVNKDEKSV